MERGSEAEFQTASLPPEPVDDLGLEQPDHALGERVVVRVADAADGGIDTGLGEPLGVTDADVLRSAVAMMDKAVGRPPGMQGLLQRVENEAGCLPASRTRQQPLGRTAPQH